MYVVRHSVWLNCLKKVKFTIISSRVFFLFCLTCITIAKHHLVLRTDQGFPLPWLFTKNHLVLRTDQGFPLPCWFTCSSVFRKLPLGIFVYASFFF